MHRLQTLVADHNCAPLLNALVGDSQGLKDNGLPAVYTEFERFKNAPRASIETLHVRHGLAAVALASASDTSMFALTARAVSRLCVIGWSQHLDRFRNKN